MEILLPYFKAGLENNEFCLWITSEPLTVEEAVSAMAKVMPMFDQYLKQEQMAIIDYTRWYVKDGYFYSQRVLDDWIEKLQQALAKGFEGLWLSGNTFWLEEKDWQILAGWLRLLLTNCAIPGGNQVGCS